MEIGIDRRRHAIEPAHENDFAIQIFDFIDLHATLHALPGRSARKRFAIDGAEIDDVCDPFRNFAAAVIENACGFEALFGFRSEEHTYEIPSLMRNSYAVFCLKTKNTSPLF